MSAPLVSAIVPVFNCERFVGAAIDSVLAQTYAPVEVIVVDDGSSDAGAAVAEARGVKVLRREHAGVSAARNAGIEAARGELITFLDADDLWPHDRLEHQVGYFRDHPGTEVLVAYASMFLEPGEQRPEWLDEDWIASLVTEPIDGVESAPGMSGAVPVPLTMMVRAELFEALGGFDTSYAIGEDIDWLMRASDAGYSHDVLKRVVMHYRLHSTNTVYRLEEMERAQFRVIRSSLARKRTRGAARP
jgi:glycosyltransferase involved in cell wall biosynthesis